METKDIIKQVRQIVKKACLSPNNIYGDSSWDFHIKSVVFWGKKLAKELSSDQELIELACLLHDIAAVSDKKYIENHHIDGARMADEILNKFEYPRDRIEIIKKCVLNHRGSTKLARSSLEEQIVADADAMSHIEQSKSLLRLAYSGKHLGVKEGADWVLKKLERSWNKMSPLARDMIKEKYILIKNYLK
jgi:uncharacterized protein